LINFINMLPLNKSSTFVCQSCSAHLHARRRIWNFQRVRNYALNASRPFRLAIIGSGPAGFYTAYKVMREHSDARIDMYEHFPVPYGLVRFGVAPDHPEVKNCQETLDTVAESPNFDFIGNINVGHDLPLEVIKPHYDAILFAYGASKDKDLGIPGENLRGVYSARDFVAWYNGLPGYAHLTPRLEEGSDAVIIGQGNVAMDVARVLLSDVDRLRKTDMPEYALDVLSRSRIRKVHVVGRRGPTQVSVHTTITRVRDSITNLYP
jgi:adrenodoxin-NADP+ reductase